MKDVRSPSRPPLSRFRVHDGVIYVSGQVPIRDGAIVSDDFVEQTHQTLKNLDEAVTAAGGSIRTILKCTCYVRRQEDLETFNAIYREFFDPAESFPARTTLIANPPNPRVLVEIEATATVIS